MPEDIINDPLIKPFKAKDQSKPEIGGLGNPLSDGGYEKLEISNQNTEGNMPQRPLNTYVRPRSYASRLSNADVSPKPKTKSKILEFFRKENKRFEDEKSSK